MMYQQIINQNEALQMQEVIKQKALYLACKQARYGSTKIFPYTVWLQIFVVENFRNFCNYTVITKILFTKISSQLIILDTIGTR